MKEDIKLFLKIIKGEDGKKNVNGWMDIESVIECLITKNEISMSRFFNYEDIDNSNKEKITFFDFCYELNLTENYDKAHELMQSLKQFTDEFCKFIQIQVDHLKDQKELIEILKNELNREISFYKPSQDAPFIEKIDIFNNIHKVINYNYSTLSELFTEYSKNTIHVNGKSEDETAIFGINEDIELKNQETLNKYVIYLFKQTQRIINHIPRFTDEQLNLLESNHFSSNSQTKLKEDVHGFNLIIYGHSCSPADFDVIKRILTHKNLKTAVVLCHDKNVILSLYSNLRKMLEPHKLSEMIMYFSDYDQRIVFIERQKS